MNKFIYFFLFTFCFIQESFSQNELTATELTFDGFFSASTLGNSFGIGPKIGLEFNKNLYVGPSVRIQRARSNNLGNTYTQTVYGGGIFGQYRLLTEGKTTFFGGAEFEYLLSPYNYLTYEVLTSGRWAPTFFICGGFNLKISKFFSLNAGIYYDLINAKNSPFRTGYAFKIKNEQGQIIRILPMLYRVSINIPFYVKK